MDHPADASRPHGEAPSLSKLREQEVLILELLGEGHTVKSIAQLTGRSPAWINERLRDARRKTGTGSSRELARHLRHQQGGNKIIVTKEIGLVPEPLLLPPVEARPWRFRPGVLIGGSLMMITLLIAALAMSGAPREQATTEAAGLRAAAPPSRKGPAEQATPRYLLSVAVIRSGRRVQPVRMLVQERAMVRYSADEGLEASMVVMPAAQDSASVDVALSLKLMDRPDRETVERKVVTTTVNVPKGGSARLDLPPGSSSGGGIIEVAIEPVPPGS
ncbi:MAG TPA: hypothetical protein VGB48_06690 [Allosphingosinicella sp.]|jgi:DNA-binding CsgD family transcriptional regulator